MDIAIPVFGGLGLFLYGMNLMGDGLQRAAGNRLKKIVEVLTRNRLMGVVVGALVTMIIQSSSATTVMVVGFVNAGIMDLSQAVGVIMGANIGTTMTAQLLAFNLTDYAPLAVAIGVILQLISKNKRGIDVGDIFVGFGILFIGMDFMSNGLEPLAQSQVFTDILVKLKNPFLAAIVGLGLTTILQSSSASIGLLQALAGQGLIDMDIAFPVLLGENIGTTTTALISSIGANKTAKRAAVIHFLFNLIGTMMFLIFLKNPVQRLVVQLTPGNVPRQIANSHTLFNFVNVIVQFPFADLLVKAAEAIIPGEDVELGEAKYLDDRILETPSIALSLAMQETLRMADEIEKNIDASREAFINDDYEKIQEVFQREIVINKLEKEITKYVLELTNLSLTQQQHDEINDLIYAINDLERVGDHADNIAELAEEKRRNEIFFTEDAADGINLMFDKTKEVYNLSVSALKNNDENKALRALALEAEVNELEQKNKDEHLYRLNHGQCTTEAGVIFLDALSNLERISDHSVNIGRLILK